MELTQRIDAVRQQMAASGVVLVACSNGLHMPDRPDPVVHLSGYRSVGESFVLLPRDGDVRLIVSPAADSERVVACFGSLGAIASDDPAGLVSREIADARSGAANVALVGLDSLPHTMARELLGACGGSHVAWDETFYSARRTKTPREIERARCAASIAEKGLERLLALVRPGVRECDLAVELKLYMESLGADDNFLMLCSSRHNPAVMPSSTRKIESGDLLITELTPSFEGQFVQICRTVSIGEPRAALREKYDLVKRAMWAGIETIRPGVPMSQVCAAIDRVISSAGYAEYCRPPHMRRRGHGLGCGSVAPGDVATDNTTLLEEDMLFVVHPNQYLPETGYLMCGEPVRVTATGVEVLTSSTATLRCAAL